MLQLLILGEELYDESTEEFIQTSDIQLELEHSLVSMSKWESKFEVPFLASREKSNEEILGYVSSMVLSETFNHAVLVQFSQANLDQVNDYINSKQTATTFGSMPDHKGPGEIITTELIYYWMVAFNIPFECQHWHINRLFALIRICNIKNSKPKKLSRHEIAMRNRELNAQRKAQWNTSG